LINDDESIDMDEINKQFAANNFHLVRFRFLEGGFPWKFDLCLNRGTIVAISAIKVIFKPLRS